MSCRRFSEGDKLLCYHGALLYEAKCLKSREGKYNPEYKVHYMGWNKKWDEWVEETIVLEYNAENLAKQAELKQAYLAQKSPEKKNKMKKTDTSKKSGTTRGIKRTRPDSSSSSDDSDEESIDFNSSEPFVPKELEPYLSAEWDIIKNKRKLHNLPAKLTVDELINNYVEYKCAQKYTNKEAIATVTNGIKNYFNIMIGTRLLYKFEKPQYEDILKDYPNTPMSKVYGAMHLLRLFITLHGVISTTPKTDEIIEFVNTYLNDFLKYLVRNRLTLFSLKDYESPPAEYVNKVVDYDRD